MQIFINILLVINVIVCLLIILLVLMQRPKNEGLGAAFGGGMTESLFGAETTNILVRGTRLFGGIFLFLTLLISVLYTWKAPSSVQAQLANKKAVPAPSAATASPAEDATKQKILDTINKQVEKEKAETTGSAAPTSAPATTTAPQSSSAPSTAAPSPATIPVPSANSSPVVPAVSPNEAK